MSERSVEQYDVLLIGAGIMSATVGTLLKLLEPSLRLALFERLERVAGEREISRRWRAAAAPSRARAGTSSAPG